MGVTLGTVKTAISKTQIMMNFEIQQKIVTT